MKHIRVYRRTRNLVLLLMAGIVTMAMCKTFPYAFADLTLIEIGGG